MRIRVTGKPNVDYVAKLSKEFGFKRSTIMSYWKDAMKDSKSATEAYHKVCNMIEKDQEDD